MLNTLLTTDSGPRSGKPICVIDGVPGIGKTALAVRWAHQIADRFPDGQLFVDLLGFSASTTAMPPGEALPRLLRALGATPQQASGDPEDLSGRYRSLLSKRRVLIVLDNAKDAEQVRPLLPGSHGCLVIVTSRNRLTGLITTHNARPMSLHGLSAPEWHEALSLRLGAERTTAEASAVAEIFRVSGGLPLAMAIAAARVTVFPDLPLTAIARQLGGTSGRLGALATGDNVTDVRTVFSWSYKRLSAPARRLFRLLSVAGPGFSCQTAASLAGMPVEDTR
jgi:predicted ATPase